ncbi:MAG: DNA cytosine methyltransferase, partial [Selenomonadaceae bacterium]|nr:DNA cytosine methyltransferase [Selenomonadaceae bacterium]
YGVPQTRHRIIVVGIRNGIEKSFRPPSPAPYSGKNISSQHALECPPIPPDAANHERTKHSPDVVERLKYIKPGQNAFNADIPPELQLHVKSATLSNVYRRLAPDKPSYTVTGSGGDFFIGADDFD